MTTPIGGLAWQTPSTPGLPINALANNLIGGYIANPIDAPAYLLIDPTGPASPIANGTTMAIIPGQTFFAIPGSTLPMSVASSIADHQFISVQWIDTGGDVVLDSILTMEELTVTATNTLSNLMHTPNGGQIILVVNGTSFMPVGPSPAFSYTGNVITWLSTIYGLNPGDNVSITYSYNSE